MSAQPLMPSPQPPMTFYDRISSNNSARIRIWLLHRPDVQTLIDIKYVTHTEQYLVPLALNPQSKIPLLVFNEADSPIKSLHESAVILQFLDSKVLERPLLLPRHPPTESSAAANYPNTRGLPIHLRHFKLQNLKRQLSILNSLVIGPLAMGAQSFLSRFHPLAHFSILQALSSPHEKNGRKFDWGSRE